MATEGTVHKGKWGKNRDENLKEGIQGADKYLDLKKKTQRKYKKVSGGKKNRHGGGAAKGGAGLRDEGANVRGEGREEKEKGGLEAGTSARGGGMCYPNGVRKRRKLICRRCATRGKD